MEEALYGEPENTCEECIEFYDERVAIAEAERRRTEGAILRDGLFGPDDCARTTRGQGVNARKRAAPILAIDNRRGKNPGVEIRGKPRTGRVLTR